MAPEVGINGKRVKFELRDIIQIVILLSALVGAWYGVKGEVSKVIEWGEPPAGRLYVLEQDVKYHHLTMEPVQQAKIDTDHDKVMRLETRIETLTEQLERNNRLLERLLNKR